MPFIGLMEFTFATCVYCLSCVPYAAFYVFVCTLQKAISLCAGIMWNDQVPTLLSIEEMK